MDAPSTVIMKLTARCNLKCDYCYMFEHADKSYLKRPAVMSAEVFKATIDELSKNALEFRWKKIRITLHGGEPLLAGKKYISEALSYAHQNLGFIDDLDICIQTNGVLIDSEWTEIFKEHNIAIGISLDGPAPANDLHRIDHKGRSSHSATVNGIRLCQTDPNVRFGGILAVIDPITSGRDIFNYFVDELNVTWMDFLLPDGNHDDFGRHHEYSSLSYANFLREVFDEWWRRDNPDIHIRSLESIIDTLIGGSSSVESIGPGAAHLLVVESDGSMEPLDVLRLSGDRFTQQQLFIGKASLTDFFQSPLIKRLSEAGNNLPKPCSGCRYKHACGGGYLPHRYSRANGFDNPSLYCAELKALIEYIWKKIKGEFASRKDGNNGYHTFQQQQIVA